MNNLYGSDDPDAGLDEGDVVHVAHLYKVVAGDTVRRFAQICSCFCARPSSFVSQYFCTVFHQDLVPPPLKFYRSMPMYAVLKFYAFCWLAGLFSNRRFKAKHLDW